MAWVVLNWMGWIAPGFPAALGAGTVTFRIPSDPVTLDWSKASGASETFVLMNIMEGLTREGGDLRPEPALAEKWTVTSDGRIWTFELRPGLKWSDGAPVRASQFRDSWLRLMSPVTRSPFAGLLDDIEGATEFRTGRAKPDAVGIVARNDHTLEVRLKRPSPWFLHLMSFWPTFPIRSDGLERQAPRWGDPGKLLTLGPWKLLQWKNGARLEFVRNDRHYGSKGLPKDVPDRIVLRVEADDSKARRDFISNQTDFLLDANTSDLLEAAGKNYHPEQFPYLSTTYLGFVVKSVPLANPDLRRALALALEPEALPPLLQGGQKVARGLIPPGLDGHDSGVSIKGSLHEARSALAKAGYPEGDGLPVLRLVIRRFDGAEKLMKYLIERWRSSLGIEVTGEVLSAEMYQSRHDAGKVDLFVQHWGADFPDAANFLEVFRAGAGTNRTAWADPEYDRRLDEARDILDPRQRAIALAAAEKILLQKGIAIFPLFHRKNTALIGPGIRELKISPLNYLFFDRIRMASAPESKSK